MIIISKSYYLLMHLNSIFFKLTNLGMETTQLIDINQCHYRYSIVNKNLL